MEKINYKAIVSDFYNPSKGSEWIVPELALDRMTDHKNLLFFCMFDNYDQVVEVRKKYNFLNVKPYYYKFKNKDNNHANKMILMVDMLFFYISIRPLLKKSHFIWKIGQVNYIFNLLFLMVCRCTMIGPISGFEETNIRTKLFFRYVPINLRVRYYFYSKVNMIGKIIFKFLLRLRKSQFIFATSNDFVSDGLQIVESRVNFDNISYVDRKSKNILWSGSLIHRKNPFFYLSVIDFIQNKIKDSSLQFHMIASGPLKCEVLKFIEEKKLNVYLSDFIPKSLFLKQLSQYDTVFVTAIREANSVFLLESLQRNFKFICPGLSGMRDLFHCYDVNSDDIYYDIYKMLKSESNNINDSFVLLLRDNENKLGDMLENNILS